MPADPVTSVPLAAAADTHSVSRVAPQFNVAVQARADRSPLRGIRAIAPRFSQLQEVDSMARKQALSFLFALVMATGSLLAVSPHYVVDPSISVDGTSLVLDAKAAGLGDVPEVSFTVTGTMDIFSRCYNRGGNKPQADNKQETIDVAASFSVGVRNGQTTINKAQRGAAANPSRRRLTMPT